MGLVVLATTTFAQAKQETKKSEKAKTEQSAPKVKKDGTPDKRFKASKDTTGPLKKDGSKDMRFKKNKKG